VSGFVSTIRERVSPSNSILVAFYSASSLRWNGIQDQRLKAYWFRRLYGTHEWVPRYDSHLHRGLL